MKVDSGLKDLRASMRLMNSEMRNNMSVFDRSERSLQKYGVQLDGLNKKLEAQKVVVESARKRYDKMVDAHGEGSVEAQKAAATLNHESAQLNNLERHISKVTKEMQAFKREQEIQSSLAWKTGDAFESFGNRLEGISDRAKSVGKDLTKYLTLPITGLMTTVGGMGFKRAMDLEQVEFMMRHISDSTGEFEKRMGTVTDLVTDTRFGTAEIGNEFAKLIGAGAGDESAKIFNEVAMNLATFKSDDSLIQRIGDIYAKALQGGKIDGTMLNQFTDAGVDIAKVLGNKWGKSTEDVKKILQSGNFEIEEVLYELSEGVLEGTEGVNGATKAMGGMLEGSGKLLSGQIKNFFAAVSQTGERLIKETGLFDGVKDALDELRNMLKSGELDSLFTTVFSGVSKALEALVDIMRKVFKWFSSLDDSTKEWIGKLVGLLAVIGPIITGLGIFGGVIAKISKGLGVFLKWIAPVTKGLGFVGKDAGGAGKSVGLLSRAFTFMTGPVGIAIGVVTLLVSAFTVAYKKSETFRNFIHKLGEKIKEIFFGIVDWVTPGFNAITGFFDTIKEKISTFVKSEGPSVSQAFQNIWSVVSPILEWIADKVKWAFDTVIKPIINIVMKGIEIVIKTIWGNIKGIITGVLDVIMGAVKIFSGLFTGDWTKMWEGVKQLTSGAIKIVWNWIQLQFIGRILKGVGGLAKGFWGHIKNMWAWVKETFKNSISTVYNGVKNSFVGRIITSIINFVKNFRQRITDLWNGVKNTFTNSISTVYNGVKNSFVGRIITSIINFVKNFRTHISNLWTRVKDIFSRYISNIRQSIANSFVGRIITSITRMKDNFIRIAKDMWTGVKKQFDKIVDGAKNLPGRIGKGISNAKDKATNAMKSVGNGIISSAGKPFNKVVDGVNWVTGKLGIKKKIPKWDYPQYAKGTRGKGHPGGIAMIGEKGRELVKLPDGRSFVSPDSHTILDLPKGTHVIPNKPTEQIIRKGMTHIPQYAKGTDGWLSSLASHVGDVFGYLKSPKKLLNKILDKISVGKQVGEIPKAMVGGAWDYVKEKPYEYIKKMLGKAEEKGGALQAPVFGGKFRLSSVYGPRWGGFHGGVDFAAPTGTPIRSQSNGKVSFAGYGWNGGFGNLVRVINGIYEHYYAHMSAVMAKTGQQVKQGDILGLVGSTGDSTGPHVHYEIRRNGQRLNPLTAGKFKGFKTGGLIKSPMMAMLGEEDEEVVIPTHPKRRTDAMKLLALAAKKIGVDDGSFVRPNGINGSNSNDDIQELKEMVKLLTEQNEHSKRMIELLIALLGKDLDLYKLNKKVDEGLNNISNRRGAAWGGN